MSDAHLTEPNPQLAEWQRKTPNGMAHWAGTGPEGKTCRECEHWQHEKRYYAKRGLQRGTLKPARCRKYKTMMNGQTGGEIPHDARSCKYFAQALFVPPIAQER